MVFLATFENLAKKTGFGSISLCFDVDIFAFWKSFDVDILGFQKCFDVGLSGFYKIWLLFSQTFWQQCSPYLHDIIHECSLKLDLFVTLISGRETCLDRKWIWWWFRSWTKHYKHTPQRKRPREHWSGPYQVSWKDKWFEFYNGEIDEGVVWLCFLNT